jgi:hypothetical protein
MSVKPPAFASREEEQEIRYDPTQRVVWVDGFVAGHDIATMMSNTVLYCKVRSIVIPCSTVLCSAVLFSICNRRLFELE